MTSNVYKATSVVSVNNDDLNETVAIKNVKLQNPNWFEDEVESLSLLNHPNIIKLVGLKFPTLNDDR